MSQSPSESSGVSGKAGSAGGEGASVGGESKNRYRGTLNLPQTAFAMKANLVQNEPASLKRWTAMGLYERVRGARAGSPAFVFHDGPPYANGPLHLGHLFNKVLKDLVVRSKTMQGLDCRYVPGWDCHGLPIEHKVMTDLVESGKAGKLAELAPDHRQMAVRRECQKHAEKYHKLQSTQVQKMLTLADYEHPYLTMQKEFEGATLELLAELVEQGLVFRALKPVHWSVANETALAEAELEYQDREDLSVYVDFVAENAAAVYDAFGLPAAGDETQGEDTEDGDEGDEADSGEEKVRGPRAGERPDQRPCFMIWTTTPWTLPANLAIAVNEKFVYALVWVDGNVTIMAADAVDRVCKAAKSEQWRVLATTTGEKLVGLKYQHPFMKPYAAGSLTRDAGGRAINAAKVWSVVAADYVTLEDGTGLVHTAPGHGQEDYQTGMREGLPVYSPVEHDGVYANPDARMPQWLQTGGKNAKLPAGGPPDVWTANELIVQKLESEGSLFYQHRFTHSYPHDWRSKTPTIFRCTEQWFIGVDKPAARDGKTLRAAALAAVESGADAVRFVPEWGRNRMRGMLDSRPDWCISRQRAWGLPIPAFFTATGKVLLTAASARAVAKVVREKGSDAWFQATPEELLKHYVPGSDAQLSEDLKRELAAGFGGLRKGNDILDVWFESGSSWHAVMRERGLGFPVDLYLEGSDQHRGWFQASMLPALGATGKPPFRTLLTHGFINDKDGKKLSKSRPDAKDYEVDNLLVNFGSDVMRWWVSSLTYENDVKADTSFFAEMGESYRKVRNTLRFMLSNLYDYTQPPEGGQGLNPSNFPATSVDAWALGEFDALRKTVVDAYNAYDFRTAHQALYDFCNTTMSAVYFAAIKDRCYCDGAASVRRRRTQAALFHIADGLCRLLAPVLPHTADEAWRALHRVDAKDTERSVHLMEFPAASKVEAHKGWADVMKVRDAAMAAMEKVRSTHGVDNPLENPLDMGVTLPDPEGKLAAWNTAESRHDLADLLGVSRVSIDGAASAAVVADLRNEPRCERSWRRDGTVKVRSDGGMLSDRDAAAVGVA